MAEVGLIRVLQQVLVKGVVYSWLGEARYCVVITAFSIRVDIACLPALAPIGIASELQLLYGRFY